MARPARRPSGARRLPWRADVPLSRLVRLRPWQKAAFDAFWASAAPDFLAVATPGAGKTAFALTAARQALAQSPGGPFWWAPPRHPKSSGARPRAPSAWTLDPGCRPP